MTKPADRRAAVAQGGVLQADTGREQPFPSTALQSLEMGCRKTHSPATRPPLAFPKHTCKQPRAVAGALLREGCLTSELGSSCESRGGRPGLSVPNRPYGLCGRKATFEEESKKIRAHEPCQSRGVRLCERKATFEGV